MPRELSYDLRQYRLSATEHKSGCPAKDEKQEACIVRLPSVEGLVQSGTSDSGAPVFTQGVQQGARKVSARCQQCGAERLFDIDEATLDGLVVDTSEEVDDG